MNEKNEKYVSIGEAVALVGVAHGGPLLRRLALRGRLRRRPRRPAHLRRHFATLQLIRVDNVFKL